MFEFLQWFIENHLILFIFCILMLSGFVHSVIDAFAKRK